MMDEKFQIEATEVSSKIQQAIDAVNKLAERKNDDAIINRTSIETRMILRDALRVFESMTVRAPTHD